MTGKLGSAPGKAGHTPSAPSPHTGPAAGEAAPERVKAFAVLLFGSCPALRSVLGLKQGWRWGFRKHLSINEALAMQKAPF